MTYMFRSLGRILTTYVLLNFRPIISKIRIEYFSVMVFTSVGQFFKLAVVICRFLDQIYRHIFDGSHFAKLLSLPSTHTFWNHSCLLLWTNDLTFLESDLNFTSTLENKVLCKNLTCNKFEKYLEFFRFLKRKKNMKIACFFFFWWGFFKET